MALAKDNPGLPLKHNNLSKKILDTQEECVQTIGEDCGLGKILLGIRLDTKGSSLEVRVVKGDGLRSFRVMDPDAPKPSTYCTVIFLPDNTEPVSTATVESSDCPHWRGAFRFEKFPSLTSSTSQRCLRVQVMNSATDAPISEATLLLGNWSMDDYERGVRVWKYLNGTQETQRSSGKEGNACMTLFYRSDRIKLILHRVEDLSTHLTAASEPPEFFAKLLAIMSGRVVKEATLKGLRCTPGGDVNFYEGRFSVRLGKYSPRDLTLRLVLTRQIDSSEQELHWIQIGTEVKRLDCRSLYQSLLENPNQGHVVSVRLNKPPVPPIGYQPQEQQKQQKPQEQQHLKQQEQPQQKQQQQQKTQELQHQKQLPQQKTHEQQQKKPHEQQQQKPHEQQQQKPQEHYKHKQSPQQKPHEHQQQKPQELQQQKRHEDQQQKPHEKQNHKPQELQQQKQPPQQKPHEQQQQKQQENHQNQKPSLQQKSHEHEQKPQELQQQRQQPQQTSHEQKQQKPQGQQQLKQEQKLLQQKPLEQQLQKQQKPQEQQLQQLPLQTPEEHLQQKKLKKQQKSQEEQLKNKQQPQQPLKQKPQESQQNQQQKHEN